MVTVFWPWILLTLIGSWVCWRGWHYMPIFGVACLMGWSMFGLMLTIWLEVGTAVPSSAGFLATLVSGGLALATSVHILRYRFFY